MPAVTGFAGYWAKVAELSSPLPMPIDVVMGASWVARKAHESIKGIKITESKDSVVINARVTLMGASIIHREIYKKDGSVSNGVMRRDVKPGSVDYHAYFTSRGELVLIVKTYNVYGKLEFVGVEAITLKDDGNTIYCKQACHINHKNASALQDFVGKKAPMPAK